MNIGIVGSRDYMFPDLVISYIKSLPKDSVIVSGGARGVDTFAESTANELGLRILIFKPEWDKYGKGAGFKRNEDIINHSDKVIIFWNGTSKGTKHSLDLARKYNKEVILYINEDLQENIL